MLISQGDPSRAISAEELGGYLERIADDWIIRTGVERLLLLPPDHTRLHSMAGPITAWLWNHLKHRVQIEVMPTLGTHAAMTAEECRLMFGDQLPFDQIIHHAWRDDLTTLGEIPPSEMRELSAGRFDQPLKVELNRRIVSGAYDLILSIGQVVPHEVIGFANYTKNVCIGAGGKDIIHKSHFLGAVSDMETIMGRCDTPVRQAINAAFDRFVRPRAKVKFILTVLEDAAECPVLRGVYAGADVDCFRAACDLSQQVNITKLPEPLARCVVYLDPREFKSTWLGNKAIYRTRMAMADGGHLVILAPNVRMFGEDREIDRLIREHGYRGTEQTLAAVAGDPQLAANLSAAAHLIHGSSEDRFTITYCPGEGMSQEEVEKVGYEFESFAAANQRYAADQLTDGWHESSDGEPFYFIRNPALGLWSTGPRFESD